MNLGHEFEVLREVFRPETMQRAIYHDAKFENHLFRHGQPVKLLQQWCHVLVSMDNIQKLVPWGTDGRLPLSDLDLDLGSGYTAYRRASLIDLYLRTKFH